MEPGKGHDHVDWRPQAGRRTSILFDVFVLGQRVKSLVGAAMRDAGIRPDEYAVYSVVFEAGSITLAPMARQLGMPLTTVAGYVQAMLERGHLRKTPHPRDGRASLLKLTREGIRAHRRASLAFDRAYASLHRNLDVNEKEARILLQHVSAAAGRALQAVQEQGAGRAG